MTSSSTSVSICNRALLGIGARATMSSFNENSTESDACSILFTPTFEMLARSANWNCLRQQATLSLVAAATGTPENPTGATTAQPPAPWLYSYALPDDNLKIRFLVPSLPSTSTGSVAISPAMIEGSAWIPGMTQIPYVVAYAADSSGNPTSVLLTNQSQAQAVYTVNQPNPVIWDSMFEQAMVASLGAFLVPALSLNLPLMGMCIKTADAIIIQARVADGCEGVTIMDHTPDWIAARVGGNYLTGSGSLGLYGNFVNMSWPAYG